MLAEQLTLKNLFFGKYKSNTFAVQ